MPEKMIGEIPLPMPRAVICSPSHQEHGAADQGNTVDTEEDAGIVDDAVAAFQTDRRHRPGQRQEHGPIAGVLVDDLAALLAFLQRRDVTTEVIS